MDSPVRRAAEEFWASAGGAKRFPRDLEQAIAWATPIAILKIPNLWVSDVEAWLRRRILPSFVQMEDRPLHGCMYAYAGKGLLLVNGTDRAAEMRFTIAHELAHYLLDYELVRRRAVEKLGSEILRVLDGVRPATTEERVDALLSAACIGVYRHLMYRDGKRLDSLTACSETLADELAVELLAPEEAVRRALQHRPREKSLEKRGTIIMRLLMTNFGLPPVIAEVHASRLNRQWFRGPSAREWLGMG